MQKINNMCDENIWDDTVESKRKVLAQINEQNQRKKPCQINSDSSLDSESDPFATDGELDASYSPPPSSSSSDSEFHLEMGKNKKRKLESKQQKKIKKRKLIVVRKMLKVCS